jgi:hypothetical protein
MHENQSAYCAVDLFVGKLHAVCILLQLRIADSRNLHSQQITAVYAPLIGSSDARLPPTGFIRAGHPYCHQAVMLGTLFPSGARSQMRLIISTPFNC